MQHPFPLLRGHLFWGGGTVSPTALSETNSTGTLAFDQYGYPYDSTKGNEYETNHHTTAVVSSDGSWAYQKFTNSQGDVYILVLTENFDQALTGQTINCQVISKAPTLTGGTYNGIVQLGSTDQRSDASGCTFNAPIAVLAAGTTLTGCTANSSVQCAAADITLTGCTINRKSDDSTVLWLSKYDDSNTAAGCSMTLNNCNVSCGVLVSTDGKATINGGTYNIPGEKMGIVATGAVCITGGEFTTQIVASTNGSITIENGTFNLGERKFISAAGGDITIEDGTFDSYLQAQTGSLTIKGGTFTGLVGALNGNITIEDGTFTGQAVALSANAPKYTGVLNITGGVFAKEPQGATGSLYKLSAEGASFNGMASPVYVANQTAVPQIEITYSANPAHKVIAWRFDIDNSIKQHGNSDATDPRAAVLLAQANYTHSADNRTIRFDCVPSIKYNGYTMGALNADTVFSPVLDVLPSELTFHAATENGPASVELGADMPADRIDISCFYTNVATNEVSEEYPTEAGTYQISVILKAKGLSDELKNNIYQNRVEWNGAYHQLSYANESTGNTLTSLTSENWRFQISTNTVTLTVDENGAPVIPEGAKGVRYENNTLTIDEHTTAQFAQGSTVKCDIVNNGTLDGGLFTGTVTNHGVIESGLFVNKPENADSAKFSFTSGATFCGLKDSSGITSLYAVRTENGQKLHLTASYSNPNREPFGWVQAIDIPNTTESAYLLYKNPDSDSNPWTVDVWADSALSKEETDVATTFTPVACMNSSDLSIDPTGKVSISIPEVEATGVTYTNKATKETFTSYPTVAGEYEAHVSLKCIRNWDSLASKDPVIPASALLADDGVAALSEEQENLIYRIALKGDLYYFVPKTLDVDVTVEQSAPASSVVTLTVDENGAPVIPADAKGVRYENNTLTIDANTTARFAQGSTVKCDIVNNGTLDGGLFTGTVTGSGSIARGLFLHDPKTSLPTMMLSVPENASLNGITAPDATGLTTLYAINTLDGEDNMLLFIGDYIGTDPHKFYGWDLVYSFGGEEKNSDVEKNYIGKTHFEQPMYGPIPNGQNGVKCIFLPVLEMNASDLTITADKTESKIDGAVIESVQYVDASDPNAAPSSVYPTKAGKYKAIVTLTCPGDSTYSKARVARIGNLCYHVPETLDVDVTVELPTVPPTDGDGNVTIPEGTDEVQGDGWTAKKDETTGETTVEITDGTNLGNTTLNCNKITIGSEGTSTTVSNITTNADVTVASGSAIKGGTFSGDVSGTGTIEGGTFSGNVGSEVKINGGTFTGNVDSTKINGGVFAGEIPTTVESTKVTATGGASINNIQKNEGTNQETAVQVVGEQQLSLAYTPDEGRTFYGWQKDADIIAKGDATPTVSADSTDSVYTPVVEMNLSDIQDGESNIEGTAVTSIRYYKVDANGLPEGDGYDDAPVDDGTFEDGRYVQYIALKLTDEPTENTIALYADEDVPSRVVVKNGIGYYVPEFLATGEEVRIGDIPDDTATGSGDSGAGGAAVAVIGGAAIGGAAYLIGTQVYLTSVLPEGASIPTNRQQLADLLWTAAGKPQPASTALFTDISAEAADSQKAARWCVEQGLLKDTGSTFKPDKHTFRPQVIKAWNDLQAKLNPQK
ncbi:MAG: hypothetical protein ACLSFL_09370 [Faecalibacterium sp.]